MPKIRISHWICTDYCLTSGKPCGISDPQFPHLQKSDKTHSSPSLQMKTYDTFGASEQRIQPCKLKDLLGCSSLDTVGLRRVIYSLQGRGFICFLLFKKDLPPCFQTLETPSTARKKNQTKKCNAFLCGSSRLISTSASKVCASKDRLMDIHELCPFPSFCWLIAIIWCLITAVSILWKITTEDI